MANRRARPRPRGSRAPQPAPCARPLPGPVSHPRRRRPARLPATRPSKPRPPPNKRKPAAGSSLAPVRCGRPRWSQSTSAPGRCAARSRAAPTSCAATACASSSRSTRRGCASGRGGGELGGRGARVWLEVGGRFRARGAGSTRTCAGARVVPCWKSEPARPRARITRAVCSPCPRGFGPARRKARTPVHSRTPCASSLLPTATPPRTHPPPNAPPRAWTTSTASASCTSTSRPPTWCGGRRGGCCYHAFPRDFAPAHAWALVGGGPAVAAGRRRLLVCWQVGWDPAAPLHSFLTPPPPPPAPRTPHPPPPRPPHPPPRSSWASASARPAARCGRARAARARAARACLPKLGWDCGRPPRACPHAPGHAWHVECWDLAHARRALGRSRAAPAAGGAAHHTPPPRACGALCVATRAPCG